MLVCDSGETFRESFTIKTATPELALTALENIANARLPFLAHTARVTQLRVPGCPAKTVNLQGTFVTQGCNAREGASVIFNSRTDQSFMTDVVKLYSDGWLHGIPSEFCGEKKTWWFFGRVYMEPTTQFVSLLNKFAQILNRNGCVIIAQTPLEVRGLVARGIGSLPKGELRSKVNQKVASKRRQKVLGNTRSKPGVVYFIQDTVRETIKIGFCLKEPKKRMAALQTGNSNPLRLVGHVPGSETHEKGLHRRFAKFRKQGEWFSKDILAVVLEILNCASLEEWLKVLAVEPANTAC